MSEIPEDIVQAANYVIDRMPDRRDEDLNTSDFWDLVGLEVEKAILAEREACAKIAESFLRGGINYDYESGSANGIAAAIRRR